MKKTLAFIASLMLMTTAFVSCGDKDDDDDDSTGRGSKSSSSVDRSDEDDDDKSSGKHKKDKNGDDDDDYDDYDDDDYYDDDDDDDYDDDDYYDDDDDNKPSKKSDNDIIGIWSADDAAMTEFFLDIGGDFILEYMTFEFTGNEIILDAKVDMSKLMCIQGDEFVIYDESFDYDYDGKVISIIYMDEVLAEFDRIGKADKKNVYGKYTCDDMFDDVEDGEYYLEFPEDNVAYMLASTAMEYSYDEETGKMTVIIDGESEDMDVEISGNKMYMTDEKGERVGFVRK